MTLASIVDFLGRENPFQLQRKPSFGHLSIVVPVKESNQRLNQGSNMA